MSELYTSLVRAKQELNGGVLPAMTPVPERVQHIIDPSFTPGLGSLREEQDRGLQCPVRGCGEWHHFLFAHITTKHRDIGGVRGVRRALGIPDTAGLVSSTARSEMSSRPKRYGLGTATVAARARAGKRAGSDRKRVRHSVGHRNLRNTCEAQIAQRLLTVQQRVGRSPTRDEALAIDGAMVRAAIRMYGTWNSAKAALGLKVWAPKATGHSMRYSPECVAEMFGAYYEVHGHLPDRAHCFRAVPLLPAVETVLRHMKATEWHVAMERVAIRLGVHDARYRPAPQSEAAD